VQTLLFDSAPQASRNGILGYWITGPWITPRHLCPVGDPGRRRADAPW